MRINFICLLPILVSGCAFSPRPYDGVIGYRTDRLENGLRITYINEAKLKPEKLHKHLANVCAGKSGLGTPNSSIQIQSEEIFEQEVAINIPVPIGFQTDGTSVSNGMSGKSFSAKSSVAHNESVVRHMKLKKIVALCNAP